MPEKLVQNKLFSKKESKTSKGDALNIFLKIISSLMGKIAKKAYVEFCDGKYHWAEITELEAYDAQNKLVYKKGKCGPDWKYEYSGHRDIAYYDSSIGRTTITKIYSEDHRIIYESEDFQGEIEQETWYEYNEQNKLVKTKTVNIYSAQSSAWTYVDYQYNQDGLLEKTVETSDVPNKKTEPIERFYDERGLLIKEREFDERFGDFLFLYEYDDVGNLISDSLINMGSTKTKYQYDNNNNRIRKIYDDGSEELYKTVFEKKGALTIKKVFQYKVLSEKKIDRNS